MRRLARIEGLELILAGRSLAKAEALMAAVQPAARTTLQATAFDALSDGFDAVLKQLQVHVVVHTSGPFQGQDYRVAEACIAAGAHYIDLADGHAFVAGISRLDDAARRAGVLVTSGASSVPALSSAAADHLSAGLQRVDRIDIGISPGNRTERGLATVSAILSYCGQPLAGAQPSRTGWWGTWRRHYPPPVGTRLLSPCDVPDLSLLPLRYPGSPEVRFGAGLELRFLHRGMNAMALLARWGWVRNWSRHARWLKAAADLFRHWGSDAGAMHVSVEGCSADGTVRQRHWTLVAAEGDGPYVPTLAAAALVRRLAQGRLAERGAMPCLGLLTLDDFATETEGLAIRFSDDLAHRSMYEAVLGPRFEALPEAVRRFHTLAGRVKLRGQVVVEAPRNWRARLLGRLLGTPLTDSAGPIRFELDAAPAHEHWVRHFPGRTMASRLRLVDGRIVERLGAATLVFGLRADADRLSMELLRMRFLGLPCPRWLMPKIVAEERGHADAIHFDVAASVRGCGVVARYHGHLELPA